VEFGCNADRLHARLQIARARAIQAEMISGASQWKFELVINPGTASALDLTEPAILRVT
jgi:hypothetical protein